MNSTEWFMLLAAVGITVLVGLFYFKGSKVVDECAEKGGVLIRGYERNLCVDAKILKEK